MTRTHGAVEAVWRIEAARVVAALTRLVRDVGLAEELAQDALVAALEQWPAEGVPRNPGAWLMTVAKRRAIDLIRREENYRRKLDEVGRSTAFTTGLERHEFIEDDVLRLVFTACHPVLPTEAKVALTLRLLGGLTTGEIARAFLATEPAVAQRIVRAKKALAKAEVEFEVPEGPELAERLASVLEVVYLVFNEGYTATAGDDWMRPELCAEALRLARLVAALMPAEPEAQALQALLEIQASRTAARTDAAGDPVLLTDQNRDLWNRLLITRGLAALAAADALTAERGVYHLQAAIAACHARAHTVEGTDWRAIAGHYEELARRTGSPVVELNRAVALSMAYGPALGLTLLDQLTGEPSLRDYHLLPAVRGDLLVRLDRREEARAELQRAAALTRNARERALLLSRAADL
ncbi:RNA polymerase sigma factor [Actinocorallia longicatena]|uniref:RNA polymerase sigma factor n=1 Tax=Actinocorallia longicatena TaxID=111803 RepID=A0ABP6Q0W7_9ACTN